jgi:hypothetical protein
MSLKVCHALGICSSHALACPDGSASAWYHRRTTSQACLCSQIVHALLLYMSISSSYSYFLLKST